MFESLTSQTRDSKESGRLRAQVREALALSEEVVVLVSELRCGEPGCSPIHTVISVLRANGIEKFKFQKEMAAITDSEIAELGRDGRQDLHQRSATK